MPDAIARFARPIVLTTLLTAHPAQRHPVEVVGGAARIMNYAAAMDIVLYVPRSLALICIHRFEFLLEVCH